MDELPLPPVVRTDPRARELLRVWAAHGAQHITIAAGTWTDSAAWGIMLVDLARHIANAVSELTGEEYLTVITRIREGFDAEWNTSTDEVSGEFLK